MKQFNSRSRQESAGKKKNGGATSRSKELESGWLKTLDNRHRWSNQGNSCSFRILLKRRSCKSRKSTNCKVECHRLRSIAKSPKWTLLQWARQGTWETQKYQAWKQACCQQKVIIRSNTWRQMIRKVLELSHAAKTSSTTSGSRGPTEADRVIQSYRSTLRICFKKKRHLRAAPELILKWVKPICLSRRCSRKIA